MLSGTDEKPTWGRGSKNEQLPAALKETQLPLIRSKPFEATFSTS